MSIKVGVVGAGGMLQYHAKSVGDIKVTVHRMRKRYRTLLEKTVADTVTTPEEVQHEIGMLAAAFS